MNFKRGLSVFFQCCFSLYIFSFLILTGTSLYADGNDPDSSEWTLFQLALFNPVQVFDSDYSVYGVRLNFLYGVNRNVWGLDMGAVNKARDVYGIQAGLFSNIVQGDMGGFQISIANDVAGDMMLMQTAFYRNVVEGNMYGLQTGLVSNTVHGNTGGIQTALILNSVTGHVAGIQTA